MNWRDILKIVPSDKYAKDDRYPDVKREGKKAETRVIPAADKTAIIFSPHYMYSLGERPEALYTSKIITPEIEQILVGLNKGTYWFYLNSAVSDHSYGMIEVIGQMDYLPHTAQTRQRRKLGVLPIGQDPKERYEKGIIFTHVNDGHNYPKGLGEPLPLVYKDGIKMKHREKTGGK